MNPRIISGKFKNQKLKVPQNARPVTDRIKTSIFDTLGELIKNAQVLDLFAGSGSFGFEALSRGANFCVFVDNDSEATNIILQNAQKLKLQQDSFRVVKSSFKKFIKNCSEKFDIVFIDPPFNNLNSLVLDEVDEILNTNGIIILKWPSSQSLNQTKYFLILEKTLGSNKIYFLKKN
ncbi:MAG: RNA methyltransferase [Candidatus Dojkabacteria bacterium]|nr:MAG: RNA methyltransferase [Candidatus Dojkabacteria bacterium]